MASRSQEAAGDGWGHDEEDRTANAHRDPATGPPTDRQRHLRTRVAELEAELDRSERRIQRVIDEYEALLERRTDPPGPLERFRAWLLNL